MKPSNLDAVLLSFSGQAAAFENTNMNFSKKEYLLHLIREIDAKPSDQVLETASGTCICGRSLAPFVRFVTCLDATPAMLKKGKEAALTGNLTNMNFLHGCVEELPFADDSFDIVMTRLSFHHFPEISRPFAEMYRVLKPGGKLVIIDMEATEEILRETEDAIETLRDPSHVKNCSRLELEELYLQFHCEIVKESFTPIPVSLQAWMDLTQTPEPVQTEIRSKMETEINGGSKTGFAPYYKEDALWFKQRWMFLMGIK